MGKRQNRRRAQSATPQPRVEAPAKSGRNAWLPVRVLLLIASAIAVYLAWISFNGGSLPGCGPSSGCDKVLQSRWSHWLGIPVTLPALLVYASLLGLTFSAAGSSNPSKQRASWTAIGALAITVLGAAFWFVGLQAVVIKSFCYFCLTAHASAAIAAVLLLKAMPWGSVSSAAGRITKPASILVMSKSDRAAIGLASAVALVVLLGGQAFVTQKQFAVKTVEGMAQGGGSAPRSDLAEASARLQTQGSPGSAPPAPPSPAAKAGPNSVPPNISGASRREIVLHQGKFKLFADELPIIGSPNAKHVIVSLFDYTCHYCREMHGLLLEAQRKLGAQLAIVSLPMPLDSECNHIVKRTSGSHVNACQYAKLGLAVWRAKPEAFPEFDAWLFHSASPPPLNEARQRAEQLAGREKLEATLADDWVKNQVQTDIAIYEANSRELKDGRMPQLVIGQAISVGPLEKIEQLYAMLAEQLGLK